MLLAPFDINLDWVTCGPILRGSLIGDGSFVLQSSLRFGIFDIY